MAETTAKANMVAATIVSIKVKQCVRFSVFIFHINVTCSKRLADYTQFA